MEDLNLNERLICTNGAKYFLVHETAKINISEFSDDDSHIHDFIEVYLNISGNVSFLVKNKIYPVSHGDIILTRASEFHHCIYHSSCTHEHFCLWIKDSDGGELTEFIKNSYSHLLKFSQTEKEEIIKLFTNLSEATASGDLLCASSLFLNILVKMRQKNTESLSSDIHSELPEEFRSVLDYINLHYGDITNVSELCQEMFVSLSTLNRQFRKHLHITPKSYLESVKLSNARRMLSEGASVTDVCFECGYCDSSHFIRIFKKKFGVTPRKYKEFLCS